MLERHRFRADRLRVGLRLRDQLHQDQADRGHQKVLWHYEVSVGYSVCVPFTIRGATIRGAIRIFGKEDAASGESPPTTSAPRPDWERGSGSAGSGSW